MCDLHYKILLKTKNQTEIFLTWKFRFCTIYLKRYKISQWNQYFVAIKMSKNCYFKSNIITFFASYIYKPVETKTKLKN